jgi:hypothetical protein
MHSVLAVVLMIYTGLSLDHDKQLLSIYSPESLTERGAFPFYGVNRQILQQGFRLIALD